MSGSPTQLDSTQKRLSSKMVRLENSLAQKRLSSTASSAQADLQYTVARKMKQITARKASTCGSLCGGSKTGSCTSSRSSARDRRSWNDHIFTRRKKETEEVAQLKKKEAEGSSRVSARRGRRNQRLRTLRTAEEGNRGLFACL